jgi:hypothetical protein
MQLHLPPHKKRFKKKFTPYAHNYMTFKWLDRHARKVERQLPMILRGTTHPRIKERHGGRV